MRGSVLTCESLLLVEPTVLCEARMKLSAQFDTGETFCGLSGNSRGGEVDGEAPFVSRDERFGLGVPVSSSFPHVSLPPPFCPGPRHVFVSCSAVRNLFSCHS